jgi:membrane glycosyltransferase
LVDLTGDEGRALAPARLGGWRVAFEGPAMRRQPRPAAGLAPQASAPNPPRRAPDYPALSSTPAASPLAMPRQDLRASARAPRLTEGMLLRRLLLLIGALAISAMSTALLFEVLRRQGLTPLEWLALMLSAMLSAWVGFGFMSATAGFVATLPKQARAAVAFAAPAAARTAILLPTYNEDPGLILAAVQAICEDLGRLGLAARYDVFILSDTRDVVVARREASGLLRLRPRLTDGPPVFYRRRALNTDRKAGNIGDWVESHGGAYDFMLVLDADSLMTGETIATLTAEIERDPACGLVQTVPTIINAETPFARLQQFASRLYGPMFARGQAWWSGPEGNYWGHNAIIRVAAFAESAGLPHLTGPRPFGGHIMSHDFIEAALLRRRGWAVRTIAGLGGSYEETPPTLLDTAIRDRRWCQGNLQHARVLASAGLHWVSRLHLTLGIAAYLAPACWLALVVCGAIIWPSQHVAPRSVEMAETIVLFSFTLALLAAPKAMALILALTSRRGRASFGGAFQLLVGFFVECVASMLMTPVMMVMQSVAVAEVLVGRDSGWSVQRREGAELRGRDAWRAHRGHVILGLAGALGALLVSKYFLMWASPVFLSLTLSALLSLHTSKAHFGSALRRRGLFQIPEDEAPPPVLERALALRRAYADEAPARRQIDALFREDAAVYKFAATRPRPVFAGALGLVSPERQPVMTW